MCCSFIISISLSFSSFTVIVHHFIKPLWTIVYHSTPAKCLPTLGEGISIPSIIYSFTASFIKEIVSLVTAISGKGILGILNGMPFF